MDSGTSLKGFPQEFQPCYLILSDLPVIWRLRKKRKLHCSSYQFPLYRPSLQLERKTPRKSPAVRRKIVGRRGLKTGETLHRLDLHLYQNSNLPITASTPPLWGACKPLRNPVCWFVPLSWYEYAQFPPSNRATHNVSYLKQLLNLRFFSHFFRWSYKS